MPSLWSSCDAVAFDPNHSLSQELECIDNTFLYFYSLQDAALDILNTIQQESLFPFSNEEYEMLKSVFVSNKQTAFRLNEKRKMQVAIDKKNTRTDIQSETHELSSTANLICLSKRNEVFATNIIKVHKKFKQENLVILVRMGDTHLDSVSQLLKEKGIAHTCVNLEIMQATEVLPNMKYASSSHKDL